MTMEMPVGESLAPEVLARQTALPRKPAPVTLRGKIVELAPLDVERDADALHAVSNGQPVTVAGRSVGTYDADALVWRYMAGGPFATRDALATYLTGHVETPNLLPLVVRELATGHPIGVATFMSNEPAHLKIELGNIWYSPVAQRTGANTESTYLMLRHAFGLGYRRLEWKCDSLNRRSREAALKMGFTFEGIQDSHFIVKGRNRDTAWFRLLDREWPDVKARLEASLAR